MHGAPSVSYPVGRSLLGAALLFAASAVGGGVLLGWSLATAVDWRQGIGACAWLLAGALAWHSWRTGPEGELAWDGAQWHWRPPAKDGLDASLHVLADFQSVLLLRLRWTGGGGTAWLLQARAPQRWAAFRRAVYSPAGPGAPVPGAPFAEP